MAKNTYETLFILDSNQYARDPGGVSKQIEQIITENEGNVLVSRMWMEQRLAYPIDKHQKGTYWLTYFEIEGEQLVKIERAFQLCEPILRELTLKLDPRLVEPMLANARGETFTLSNRSEEETDDSDDNSSDDANAEDDSVVSSEA
ncbi:30S ribosomal protein S6 [Novipirellula sp.]|uniref:30S ribosomal protein S6 n=1 Tax=Novipirellula sp. TaxID=2795430 RepID=UPI0035619D5F